ncbi:MAG TPA: hypothetical protein PLZ05_01065 [Alphaproteobacteria bacterium]|nr:hypothetical protein [Alphaproteobacteria bacterium]
MIKKISDFLRTAFPFLAVLVLWHLSVPFWNPGGILALIPIFYYSFINPVPWFVPYAAVFCFLIDYKFDTLLFWTFIYCMFYAANGFQNFVDLTRQKNEGVMVFMAYFSVASFLLVILGWNFIGLFRAIWLVLWLGTLYIPFAALAQRIKK